MKKALRIISQLALTFLIGGLTVMLMWQFLLEPVFHTHLTLKAAVGIVLLVGYVNNDFQNDRASLSWMDMLELAGQSALFTLLAWGVSKLP